MCRSLVLPLFLLTAILCTGCCTPTTPAQTGQTTAPPRARQLQTGQVDRFQSAASAVFQAHGFVEIPSVVVATDSTIWLITARTRLPGELTMATVKITPEGQVAVDLPAYQRIGADWAMLGRLFRGLLDQEASAMKLEIQEQLEGKTKPPAGSK